MTLYYDDEGNFDADQFMIDVTEVLHGVRYDPDEGLFWNQSMKVYGAYGGGTSPYFLAGPESCPSCIFHTEADLSNPDAGWASEYRDGDGNQAYHFWFYVAVAYFDGKSWAKAGNHKHDGAYPGGPGEGTNRLIDNFNLVLAGLQASAMHAGIGGIPHLQVPRMDTGSGVSEKDYDLGVQGANGGSRIRFWGAATKPEHLYEWLCTDLSE